MDSHLFVPQLGMAYHVTYCAAFVVGVILLYRQARRMGWDGVAISAGVGWMIVGAVVVSRLATALPDQLLAALLELELPAKDNRSLLGGLLGGLLGVALATRLHRIPAGFTDAVAAILPVCMAIGRLGCLLAGCCFGTVTDGAWGIRYAPGSPAHSAHVHAGLIAADAAASLPVVPVPLIEIACCLSILLLLRITRDRSLAPGSRLILVLAAYSVLRFAAEFLRFHPGDESLSYAQWATATTAIMLTALLLYRECRVRPAVRRSGAITGWGGAVAVASGWFVLLASPEWFSVSEAVMMLAALLALTAAVAVEGSRRLSRLTFAASGALVSLLPLMVLVGSPPAQVDSTDTRDTWRAGVSATRGEFSVLDILRDGSADGCGYDQIESTERRHRFSTLGVSLEHITNWNRHRKATLGVRAVYGTRSTPAVTTEHRVLAAQSEDLLIVNPYLRWDWKWVGLGVGMHLGKWQTADPEPIDREFSPMLSLRLFPLDSFFLEARGFDSEHASFPLNSGLLGAGVSFRVKDRPATIRFGISEWGYYLEPDVSLPFNISLYGRFSAARTERDSGSFVAPPWNPVMFGIRYQGTSDDDVMPGNDPKRGRTAPSANEAALRSATAAWRAFPG